MLGCATQVSARNDTKAPFDDSNLSPAETFSGDDALTTDSDMVLACKDGVRLHVHSLILSKWSLVINAFPGVGQCRVEGSDSQAHRKLEFPVDESSSVWRELLGLIYPVTPVTNLDWDNVEELYSLADKYNMPGILERCQSFLMSPRCPVGSVPSEGNYVLKWLAFAANYRHAKLQEKCMQHIRIGYRSIEELRNPTPNGYLRNVLASSRSGVQCIIDIMAYVLQQRR